MPVGEIEGYPGSEEGRQKKQEEGGDWSFLSTCEHHVERCGVNVKDSQTQVNTLSPQHQEAQGRCLRDHGQSRGDQHATS